MVDTVFVACSLPQGMHCDVIGDDGVGRERFTLRGRAGARRLDSNFTQNDGAENVVGNHGITEVPKDLWAKWVEQSKNTPYVLSGAVFALPKLDSVRDKAKERAKERTGLEALDPDKPAPGIEKVAQPETAAA